MINPDKVEKYDQSHRIVLFQTDSKGNCEPKVSVPEIASELVDSLYEVRSDVWKKYKEELNQGNVSPIKIFFEYYGMSLKDTASRLKCSISKVKKHLTLEGFKKMDIKTLLEYAKIFDVSAGDFFQFLYIDDKVKVDVKKSKDRLIQDIIISGKK